MSILYTIDFHSIRLSIPLICWLKTNTSVNRLDSVMSQNILYFIFIFSLYSFKLCHVCNFNWSLDEEFRKKPTFVKSKWKF